MCISLASSTFSNMKAPAAVAVVDSVFVLFEVLFDEHFSKVAQWHRSTHNLMKKMYLLLSEWWGMTLERSVRLGVS